MDVTVKFTPTWPAGETSAIVNIESETGLFTVDLSGKAILSETIIDIEEQNISFIDGHTGYAQEKTFNVTARIYYMLDGDTTIYSVPLRNNVVLSMESQGLDCPFAISSRTITPKQAFKGFPVTVTYDPKEDGESTANLILSTPLGAEGGNVIKAEQPVDPGIDLEAIRQEADQMIEEAQRQADLIIQEALDQAEANKASVYEEARSAGHDEGYAQGLSEAEQMKAEVEETRVALMQHYDQMVSELEPALVDTLSDIYGHIFSVDLSDRSEIIFYLLQKALQNTDTTVDLMIHVSKEDYEYIQSNKEALFEGMPGIDNTEIVPDVTLHQGEAMIDTGSGIFDCSIGTELEGLKKQLMLLAYRQEEA